MHAAQKTASYQLAKLLVCFSKVVNPFGRDLLSMCVTRDIVIANGRTLGDALGCCTFFADNGEGLT